MYLFEALGLIRSGTTFRHSGTAEAQEEEALLSVEMTVTRDVLSSGDGQAIRTRTALPQQISFVIPDDWQEGDAVPAEGPHGPIRVPVSEDAKPGERGTFWLGPVSYHVLVPEGAGPGTLVSATGPGNEQFCATVPRGKHAGDYFEIVPTALMVQVPVGTYPGDLIEFDTLDGQPVRCAVPPGLRKGQYFAAVMDL